MKRKHLEATARLALDLAAELAGRLPGCCPASAEDLVPWTWPLALRLTRLELRAAKGARQARAYRKAVKRARREVAALLASQDGSAAQLGALMRTIPMDPASWRVALVPGMPAHELEAQAPESEAA